MEYSVLMSLYKKENPQWFQMAVDSMVGQTVKPEQIVIVEDGRLPDELETGKNKEHMEWVTPVY